MPGRADQIDWEAIERDYRLGQLSVRELARRHDVEPSTITRRAKKEEWTRDLSEAVKVRTRAGLIEQAATLAQQHATESNRVLRDSLDVAVETNLRVLREHQTGIRSNAERLDRLTDKFDRMFDLVENMGDMARAAGSFEALVRARKTLISLEREALNLNDAPADTEDPVTSLIAAINGSALPVKK